MSVVSKSARESQLQIGFDSNFYDLSKRYHEKALECKCGRAAGVFTEDGVIRGGSKPSKAELVKEIVSRRDEAYEKPEDAMEIKPDSSMKDLLTTFDSEEHIYLDILWKAQLNLCVADEKKKKEDVARMYDVVFINIEPALLSLVKCQDNYESIKDNTDIEELWKMLKKLSMIGVTADEDQCKARLRIIYNLLECPEGVTVAAWFEHVRTVFDACDEFALGIGETEKAAKLIESLPDKFDVLQQRQVMKGIDNKEKKFQSVPEAFKAALREESRLDNRSLLMSSMSRRSNGDETKSTSAPKGVMYVGKASDQESRVKNCKKCGGTGHFLKDCPSTMESLKVSSKSSARCNRCRGKGHEESQCVN